MKNLHKWLKHNILYFAWIVAIIGMAGSLYFSEILHFAPCVLCWYQRICLYPLVTIMAVGIVKKDRHFAWYAMPLSLIGLVIAFYQNLLYYNIIPETLAPCSQGVSCTTKYIEFFGFISIPFLSLCAFVFITACLVFYHLTHKNTSHEERN